MLLVLEHISVLSDDVVEGNLGNLACLTHTVDGAHNQLIQVSVSEQVGLSGQLNLHDDPDPLLDFLLNTQHLTHLVYPLGGQVEYSLEKHVEWLHDLLTLLLLNDGVWVHLHYLLLNYLHNRGACLPGNLTHNLDFNLPEVVVEYSGHLGIEL